jgi:hypothetical protein
MPRTPNRVLPFEDQATQAVAERLRRVAGRFEPALRVRVGGLLAAASEAILQLTDLDLVRHEGDEQGSHALAVWEELAPVMGETVNSVNTMLAVAQEAFPAPAESDDLGDLDDAFGPSAGAAAREPQKTLTTEEELASLVAAVGSGLRRDVARLGERLRNPTVVADQWNLVSDLLEFRGRLRAGIGELIFQIATSVDEATRPEVIPGYAAELLAGVLLRHAATNLAFLFRGHARRIGAASDERIGAALAEALKDLHAFSRTQALPSLRTSDKRIFLETRARLFQLLQQKPFDSREIKQATENLARFLDSLSVISRREALRLHDREHLAAAGRSLEQALAARSDPRKSRTLLAAAVESAAALYGRDAQLDAYLRGQRHFPVRWLADPEVEGELERVGALLGGIEAP